MRKSRFQNILLPPSRHGKTFHDPLFKLVKSFLGVFWLCWGKYIFCIGNISNIVSNK